MENNVEGKCYICGSPLVWDEHSDNCVLNDYIEDEGVTVKEIKCKVCGTQYSYYIENVNATTDDEYYIGGTNDGFGQCAMCGGNLLWDNDFMRSDFIVGQAEYDAVSDDDDALIHCCTCSNCGCLVEALEPTVNEVKNGQYEFYKNNEVTDDGEK
jgi:hypothetical protein